MSERRACRQCGLDVVIVEIQENGKPRRIALDPRAKVYHVVKDQGGPDLSTPAHRERVMVYHGAVCNAVRR